MVWCQMETALKKRGAGLVADSPKLQPLLPSLECQRQLELLCLIVRSLTHLGDKLDDQTVLVQQQNDLIRRILKERAT